MVVAVGGGAPSQWLKNPITVVCAGFFLCCLFFCTCNRNNKDYFYSDDEHCTYHSGNESLGASFWNEKHGAMLACISVCMCMHGLDLCVFVFINISQIDASGWIIWKSS